ncbi:DUF2264 domain-containing protein [Thaumasiovibrio subtropicus]|uniref:DUF2264 domain-containing protein n=1 Tax=Thaumasiovibrio subtropicus TaxID=1891207 RepID=UPI000B35ECEC|nr:DUF2264 domain-containing protein [Thaumasiovibrio subtropicus]
MAYRITDLIARLHPEIEQTLFADFETTLTPLKEIAAHFVNDHCQQTANLTPAAHFDASAQNLEGVARLMWAVVPAADSLPDACAALRERIENGVNPVHPNYWGVPIDFDQRVVEMTSIAVAMIDAREIFFDALSPESQANLLNWLGSVATLKLPENNWRFFRILILTALELVGGAIEPIDRSVLEYDFALVERSYTSEGWYHDGPREVYDYYNPFAFHFYALTYVRWCRRRDPQRAQLYLQRAFEFAERYRFWFADDGAQLVYGRSLNYRFAAAALWGQLAEMTDLPQKIQHYRGHWQRNMQWWSQQPIWDDRFGLQCGFSYPNLNVSEFYTSAMSPLLALKAFSVLRLGPDHPFWRLNPTDDKEKSIMVFQHQHQVIKRDRGVYMLTGGMGSAELRHSADKYLKFAYSSDHGFCVESTQWLEQGFVGDNLLAFQHPETKQWFSRSDLIDRRWSGGWLETVWQPFAGCHVTTRQRFSLDGEVREHEINSDFDLHFVATGYAVDSWVSCLTDPNAIKDNTCRIGGATVWSELEIEDGGRCAPLPCAPNSNLRFTQCSVPSASGQIRKGKSVLRTIIRAGRVPA